MALLAWLTRTTPVRVVVSPVGYGTVRDTVANTRAGTVESCERAGLSPPIGGQKINLQVSEDYREK